MTYLLHIVITTCTTLIHALGYNMVFGRGKIFHFGPLGTSIGSAYVTFLTLNATGTYWAAVPAGVVAALLLSILFAWLSFRLDADGLGILTLAMHLIFLSIVLNWTDVTRGALGLPHVPRMSLITTQESFAAVILAIAIAWFAIVWMIGRSSLGRQLDAIAEHEWYAGGMGIDRWKAHLIAFCIAGVAASITNIFYHQYVYLVHPTDFGYPVFIFYVMIIVAGKPGSTLGVTISTILLCTLKEGLRFLPFPAEILGPTRMLLFGVILLAAVWYRRDTLFPKKRTI